MTIKIKSKKEILFLMKDYITNFSFNDMQFIINNAFSFEKDEFDNVSILLNNHIELCINGNPCYDYHWIVEGKTILDKNKKLLYRIDEYL